MLKQKRKDCVKDIIVPVKIIYTTDSEIIASIVRATNRQSPVPEEAFVALDNYQKNLQMIFNEYSKEMPIEVFYERRLGEPDNISNKMGEYQIVKLHGVIRNVTSVFFQEPYVVHNNNPANILRNRKDKLFCEEQQPEMSYKVFGQEKMHMKKKYITLITGILAIIVAVIGLAKEVYQT